MKTAKSLVITIFCALYNQIIVHNCCLVVIIPVRVTTTEQFFLRMTDKVLIGD